MLVKGIRMSILWGTKRVFDMSQHGRVPTPFCRSVPHMFEKKISCVLGTEIFPDLW